MGNTLIIESQTKTYTLNREDVRAFLDGLKPNGIAGSGGESTQCLVARALRWKYQKTFYVGLSGCWVLEEDGNTYAVPYTPYMHRLVRSFDRLCLAIESYHATRAQVEATIL